jgi:hypothetical protein
VTSFVLGQVSMDQCYDLKHIIAEIFGQNTQEKLGQYIALILKKNASFPAENLRKTRS